MAADGPIHERAIDSKTRSISGALLVKDFLQKVYLGFLIKSINVMSKPHYENNLSLKHNNITDSRITYWMWSMNNQSL